MWQPTRKETLTLLVAGIVLLTSLFVRLDGHPSQFPAEDEVIVMVAATKLNTPHPLYDSREYNYEHPPLGKYILGWALDRGKEYYNTSLIPINLYVYSYLAATELRDQLPRFQAWAAIIGLLFLVALFFLGRELFDTRTGIFAAMLGGLSIGFINNSRIVFQDALLPLFLTLSIIFALRYVKGNLSRTWRGIPTPYFDLTLSLLFLGASILTRIGQPPFFLLGMIIGLWGVRGKWTPFLIGSTIMGGLVLLVYPLELILALGRETYAGTFLQVVNGSILTDLLSMTSYSFIGGILLALGGGILYHQRKKINLKEKFHALNSTHRLALGMVGITFLAAVFTQLGFLARYSMVFLIIPLVYGAHAIRKYVPAWGKIIIVGLLLLDCIILVGASPDMRTHTLFPEGNPYLPDHGEKYALFQKLLDEQGVKEYFTNDARIILMDPRARPVPPFHKRYDIGNKCDMEFLETQEGKLLLYNPSYQPIGKNTFLCTLLTHERLTPVQGIVDPMGLEWYRIQPKLG